MEQKERGLINMAFKDVINRVMSDTGLSREVTEEVVWCFCLELAHDLSVNHKEVDLPYLGTVSTRTYKLIPNKFLKDTIKQKGLYASNFIGTRKNSTDGNSEQRNGSSGSE